VQDDEAAVEEFADLHAQPGIATPVRAGGHLHPALAEVDRMGARDDARIVTAQHGREIAGRAASDGRGVGEARIEVGDGDPLPLRMLEARGKHGKRRRLVGLKDTRRRLGFALGPGQQRP